MRAVAVSRAERLTYPAAPRIRVERRRDSTGDLLPGWRIVWASGIRCEHSTRDEALACVKAVFTS